MFTTNLFQGISTASHRQAGTLVPNGYPSSRTQAYVEQPILPNQPGRVHYQATYWFGVCQSSQPLPRGTEVTVLGRQGNTLIVEPVAVPCLQREGGNGFDVRIVAPHLAGA